MSAARAGPPAGRVFGEPIASEAAFEEVSGFDRNAYAAGASANISRDLFRAWWRTFPNGLLASFEHGRPFAVVGLFPVSPEWSEKFLNEKASEHDLAPAEILRGIELAAGPGPAFWYLSGLSSRQNPAGLATDLPRVIGFALLNWVRLNPGLVGLKPFSIVSEGTTAIGLRLLQRHGAPKATAGQAGATDAPRFRIDTNAVGILDLLATAPLFRRCRDLQDEVGLSRSRLART